MSGTIDWNNHEHDDREISITIMMICYWTYNFDYHHYFSIIFLASRYVTLTQTASYSISLIHETSNTIIVWSRFMKAMRSRSKSIRWIDIIITATTIIIWVVVSFFLGGLETTNWSSTIISHHQSSVIRYTDHWSTEARFAAGEFKSPWVPGGITFATKLEGEVESWKTLKDVEIIRMVTVKLYGLFEEHGRNRCQRVLIILSLY